MDSRFVNYRFSFCNFANYWFWAHFASKGFPIPIVQIVLQITVSPATNQKEKKKDKKFSDDNRKLRPGLARLHVDAERKLWKVTEVVHPSIQNFGSWRFARTCLWFLLQQLLRSWAGAADWVCFIAAAFLHKSNSSTFFSPLSLSLSCMPLSHK